MNQKKQSVIKQIKSRVKKNVSQDVNSIKNI